MIGSPIILPIKSLAQFEYFLIHTTKVSKEMIQYSRGIEQEVLSWTYLINNNIEKMIEDRELYTITKLNKKITNRSLFQN